LAEALAGRDKLRAELSRLMDAHGLDLWAMPSAPGPAPLGLDSTGDPVMNLPWTHSGLPVVNLPSGHADNGLPLGLQLAGRWQADERLLAWAGQMEAELAGVV
jgi:Asp-tRNA(Asn)/Glu-tRNA(Gln) amidotransferase A subunit family amidase